MTFQPPPPPPGEQPPPPPPPPPAGNQPQPPQPGNQPPPAQQGQWNPPPGHQPQPGGSRGFDPKTVNPLDWAILGIGVLTFIFSFVSWYTFSQGPISVSENAWHGFFGWFAMLLVLVSSAAVAAEIFAPQIKLPLAARLACVIGYAIAFVCDLLALFIIPGYLGNDVPDSVDEGHGFGFWASIILALVGTIIALMRAQQTNTALPGPLARMPKIGK